MSKPNNDYTLKQIAQRANVAHCRLQKTAPFIQDFPKPYKKSGKGFLFAEAAIDAFFEKYDVLEEIRKAEAQIRNPTLVISPFNRMATAFLSGKFDPARA